MKAKILIWMFAFLLLSGVSLASTEFEYLANSTVAYYKLENNNFDNAVNSATYQFSNTNTQNASGIIGSGRNSTVNQGMINNSVYATTYTICLWANITSGDVGILRKKQLSDNSQMDFDISGGKWRTWRTRIGIASDCTTATTAVVYGKWQFVCVAYDGATVNAWVNTTQITNCASSGGGSSGGADFLKIPTQDAGAMTGQIDEIAVFNKTLNSTELAFLYNSGSPGVQQQYPFTDAVATNFSITATDEFNSSSITGLSAYIGNTWYHSATGTLTTDILNNATTLYNITVNATGYFNRTYTSVNVTSNLASVLHMAEVCVNTTEKISGNLLSGITYFIGSKNSTSCFNVTAATHSVVATKAGWYNQTQSFTLSALQKLNSTVVNMSYANFTIYVRKANGGAYLSSYDLNISSLNYTSWPGENQTGVSNYSWYLINNTYSVTVRKLGYATNNATANITVSGNTNYTFYLYEANTLNISVYNEQTNTLLNNTNVTIDIIQLNQTSNYTTSDGTLYVTSLTAGEVEIRYADVAGIYRGRIYIVDLANLTYQEVRLYLLNTSLGSLITLDMVDQDGQDVEGGIIKAQRFYPAENLYRTIAMTRTNFNGQGSIDLIKKSTQSNVFYKFIVEIDGVVKEETDALEINPITTDILYFTINVLEDIFVSWDGANTGVVSGDLSFNVTANQFSFVWNDPTNLVREGCLKVRRIKPLTETEICNTCTLSASATILCNVTNTGDLYRAEGLIDTTTNNSLYTVDVLDYSYGTKSGTFGLFGVFLAVLFIGTFAMVGLWNPIVAIVLATVATVFCAILGMVHMTYVTVITIVILAGVIIAKSRT